jgi:autotransporter-associated beta strand protein
MALKQLTKLLPIAACGLAVILRAQTFSTALTSGTQSWNTDANWTSPATFPNATDATATFGNTLSGAMTVNLGQAITVGSISITNGSSTAANALTLANVTGGSLTWDVSAGNAALTLAAGGTSTTIFSASSTLNDRLVITVNNTTATGASGALAYTGTLGGTGGITKEGAGMMTFSTNAKSYTGSTIVNAGILRLTITGVPNATSAVTVNSGGQLQLDSTGARSYTLGSSSATGLTLNGTAGSAGALRQNPSGASDLATVTNNINVASDASIFANGSSTLTLSGAVSGTGTLAKAGSGTVVLSGSNSGYAGGTKIENGTLTVNAGSSLGTGALQLGQTAGASTTLNLNNSSQTIGNLSTSWTDTTGTRTQTVNLASGHTLTIVQTGGTTFGNGTVGTLAGKLSGAGAIVLDASSTGTLTLTGSQNYPGGTTLNGGTLLLGSGTALQNATGAFTINGGTLASNVPAATLGSDLVLTDGYLDPNGSNAGSITLAAGKNFSMSGGTLNLQLGTAYDQILGGAGSTAGLSGGTLALDVTGSGFSYENDYPILGGFTSITATGLNFTGYDDLVYLALLDPATGILSFTVAIPEPSAWGVAAGALALAAVWWRRRRGARVEPS